MSLFDRTKRTFPYGTVGHREGATRKFPTHLSKCLDATATGDDENEAGNERTGIETGRGEIGTGIETETEKPAGIGTETGTETGPPMAIEVDETDGERAKVVHEVQDGIATGTATGAEVSLAYQSVPKPDQSMVRPAPLQSRQVAFKRRGQTR